MRDAWQLNEGRGRHQPIGRTETERDDESILKINVVKQLGKVSTTRARQMERVGSGISMMLWPCKARGISNTPGGSDMG